MRVLRGAAWPARREPAAPPGSPTGAARPRKRLAQAGIVTTRRSAAHALGLRCGIELPCAAVLQAEPETVKLFPHLVNRLFDRGPEVVASVSHVSSTAARAGRRSASRTMTKRTSCATLDALGLGGVVVETANKADGFLLHPGRLCVLLTLHPQARIAYRGRQVWRP